MKTKLIAAVFVVAALVPVFALLWFRSSRPELPHFRLSDGAEFRVVQITYTPRPSDDLDHNIGSSPRAAFWLYHHLPSFLRSWVPEPDRGIGSTASDHPAISIWWARFHPTTHEPELGPAGDVIMTLDSGRQLNLEWPSPCDPGYRQIFITDPPADSRHLAFDVPVEGERVQFTIDNPAYRP